MDQSGFFEERQHRRLAPDKHAMYILVRVIIGELEYNERLRECLTHNALSGQAIFDLILLLGWGERGHWRASKADGMNFGAHMCDYNGTECADGAT